MSTDHALPTMEAEPRTCRFEAQLCWLADAASCIITGRMVGDYVPTRLGRREDTAVPERPFLLLARRLQDLWRHRRNLCRGDIREVCRGRGSRCSDPFVRAQEDTAMDSDRKRILLVDDDEDFVESNADLLEAEGYEVLCAYDGANGLELAKKEKPDLMLLDVMMARSTEGFDISRRVSQTPGLRDMKVLLVTGIAKAMHLPFQLFPDKRWLPVGRILEKPISPDRLLKEIATTLKG